MYTNVSSMDFWCITSVFSSKGKLSCKREKCTCVQIYEMIGEVSLCSVSPFQVDVNIRHTYYELLHICALRYFFFQIDARH